MPEEPTGPPPRVFVSYSHDSPEHKGRVLALVNRLRREGVDAEIDQFIHSPPEGWPLWCERQIRRADFVIVVCTGTYHRRFSGEEEVGKGRGGTWEGAILTQALYDDRENRRFVPVVFETEDQAQVPRVLTSATLYDLSDPDGYENLYRRLTNQPAVSKEELGTIVRLPPLEAREPVGPSACEPKPAKLPASSVAAPAHESPAISAVAATSPAQKPKRLKLWVIAVLLGVAAVIAWLWTGSGNGRIDGLVPGPEESEETDPDASEPAAPGVLEGAVIARGQYTGEGAIREVQGGFQVFGAHTQSAVWLAQAVPGPYELVVDLLLRNPFESRPVLWLRGPGYGNSPDSGLVLRIDGGRTLRLTDRGRLVGNSFDLAGPLVENQKYSLRARYRPEILALDLDGERLHTWSLPEVEPSALNAFIGLGASGGTHYGGQVVQYTGVRVTPAASEGPPPERVLDPSPTEPWIRPLPAVFHVFDPHAADRWSRPGTRFVVDFSEGLPAGADVVRNPGAVTTPDQGLRIGGGNSGPIVRPSPATLRGNFVAEVEMSYLPGEDTVNFFLFLLQEDGAGWRLALPSGDGAFKAIRQGPTPGALEGDRPWQVGQADLRETFFTPINGRRYRFRLETKGGMFRALSNGGEIFRGSMPAGWDPMAPSTLYFGQVHGGTLVYAARGWQESVEEDTIYRYVYHHDGRGCDAAFRKVDGMRWTESSSGGGGCLDTYYEFEELGVTDEWITLHDAGRSSFVRLPLAGQSAAQVADSPSGPWRNLHRVTLETP